MEDCSCAQQQESGGEGSLELFAAIRARCPILHRIFVPDEIWPSFQQWHQQPDTVAYHRSILLLAMERGYLGRVTSAVHRYLMTAGHPRPDVRRQYLQDLRERWMLYADPIERHEKARIFSGRLAELQCAEWLELQGWIVSGLEALREGPDIEAYANEGQATAFEVKFIGTEHDDFVTILERLVGQPAGGPVSPYDAANYLLFRVYEAAKQLQRNAYNRIWDCKQCRTRNCHSEFRPPQLNVPQELWIGSEKHNQIKLYPVPPGMGEHEWALPFSIRSFVYQVSHHDLGGCDYEVTDRGKVMDIPTFSDACGDWSPKSWASWEVPADIDIGPCHMLSGWTKGQDSCPLWEKVALLCQTPAERRFLHLYLALAKDRHFPMLIPQPRLGILSGVWKEKDGTAVYSLS